MIGRAAMVRTCDSVRVMLFRDDGVVLIEGMLLLVPGW